jgi:hypothetical protein
MVDKRFFVALVAVVTVLLIVCVPLASGQDAQPVTVEFTAYEGNPILTVGEAGAWDSGSVGNPRVIFDDGTFHMFYTGAIDANSPPAVGYATSEDGLRWTKYESNPVLEMDPAVTRAGIPNISPVFDGDTWIIFFPFVKYRGMSAESIMRATASAPTGPWTVDAAPVLEKGSGQDWDANFDIASVTLAEEEYALYYTSPYQNVGRATSPDGITWTKYDDPATTDPQYANSDPVFTVGETGTWDAPFITSSIVQYGDHGWEMFYGGNGGPGTIHLHIGYATSPDGVVWTRFGDGPVLSPPEGFSDLLPTSFVIVDGTYYLYYGMSSAEYVWNEMGVAMGTVTWE